MYDSRLCDRKAYYFCFSRTVPFWCFSTCIITHLFRHCHKDNPKLKQKKLPDGNISLYLEYYLGYNGEVDEANGKTKVKAIRKKEFLGLTIYGKPRTPIERESNSKNIQLAQEIRKEKEQEFLKDTRGYRLEKSKNTDFVLKPHPNTRSSRSESSRAKSPRT